MKQVLLLMYLFFLLTNIGCKAKIPIRNCPIRTSRIYYRYIKNNAPPLSEFYYLTSKGFILILVSYDSDGDWIVDTVIEFSDNPKKETVNVRKFIGSPDYRFFPKDKMKLKSSKRLHHRFESFFIEPPSLHPINKDRFASTEYQKAKKTVVKWEPLTNLKEENERSPETYPGLYYSGDDNLDYSEYLKLRK